MEVHQNFVQPWTMILQRKSKFSYKNLSMEEITSPPGVFLYQDYGRYMYSEKEIHELRQYFLLSILEHLDLMQLTTFLRRMHGILEMHLLGPIITI